MQNTDQQHDGARMLPSAQAPAAPAEGVGSCSQHAIRALQLGFCALLVHVPFSLLRAMSEQCSLKSLLYLPYVEKQW